MRDFFSSSVAKKYFFTLPSVQRGNYNSKKKIVKSSMSGNFYAQVLSPVFFKKAGVDFERNIRYDIKIINIAPS